MEVEQKLQEMGIELHPFGNPMASYVWAKRTGNLLFLSGHGPFYGPDQKQAFKGKIGLELTVEQGKEASRLVCIDCIQSIKETIGDLDKVKQFVKVMGYVYCIENYETYFEVHDASSDLLVEIFGERGKHARMTIGVNNLPKKVPIAIDMIVEVED